MHSKRTRRNATFEMLDEDKRIASKRPKNTHSRKAPVKETFSKTTCLNWFKEYTSVDDPHNLGPEGMEKFCEDIRVEPENVAMLVLAFKMGAKKMGFFSQSECKSHHFTETLF